MMWLALLACAPTRDCGAVLTWVGEASVVAVEGDFNGWNPESHPLAVDDLGVWEIRLDLSAGDYRYRFVVDGEPELDPFQPLLAADASGEELSLLRVSDCESPMLRLDEARSSPEGDLEIRATLLATGARLDHAVATTPDGTPLPVDVSPRTGAVQVTGRDLPAGKHTVRIVATDRDGRDATLLVPLWVEDEPFSWADAVIYEVMVDRFSAAAGELQLADPGARAGGSFAGVQRRLEAGWFDALGVNVLWLSPFYRNPEGTFPGLDGHDYEGYHGYWPVAPRQVEPALGGEAELAALITAAHARGVRVLMDLVPNHVHEQHPYAADPAWIHEDPGCICGAYTCPWSSDLQTCWFTDYLPDLAWEEPAVAAAGVADARWWAETWDLDGFRVDAVPMMPRAAVRELVHGLDTLVSGPAPLYLVGETYTGLDGADAIRANLGPFGLDGQFDFPALWALRDLLAEGRGDAAALEQTLAASEAAYAGSGAILAPILGNHDTSRFVSVAAGDRTDDPWGHPPPATDDARAHDRLVMAHAVVLALPGAPTLWQGDEIGTPGAGDPDNRRLMRFAGLSALEADTLARVQRLGQARRCSRALRRGARVPLMAEGAVFAFLRGGGEDLEPDDVAVLALNAGDAPIAGVVLPLPAGTPPLRDVLGEGALVGGALTLGPWSAALFLPEDSPCL